MLAIISIHPNTMALISLVVTLVGAGVSLLSWYNHRRSAGLPAWATTLLMSSAGTVLFILRGPESQYRFLLLLAGNSAFVAGYSWMWLSMRRSNDRSLTFELMASITVAITVVFAAVFTMGWQIAPGARGHTIVFSLLLCVLVSATAWETLRGRRIDGLQSRKIAGGAFVAIAVARLVRGGAFLAQGVGLLDPETALPLTSYTLYFMTVCIVVVTFGLVLMANEQFERDYAEAIAAGSAR